MVLISFNWAIRKKGSNFEPNLFEIYFFLRHKFNPDYVDSSLITEISAETKAEVKTMFAVNFNSLILWQISNNVELLSDVISRKISKLIGRHCHVSKKHRKYSVKQTYYVNEFQHFPILNFFLTFHFNPEQFVNWQFHINTRTVYVFLRIRCAPP